ncbi:MAG: peptidylprolyl isomerase [Fusobacteriaceae bacterium]
MAIRKFRSRLKPFIWVITVAFLLSMGAGFFGDFKTLMNGNNNVAFKINNQKVEKIQIERSRNNIFNAYSGILGPDLDKDTIGIVAADEVINKILTIQMAKDMKISVSNSEVQKQYKEIEKSVGDKEQFKRSLLAAGFTSATLKEEIKSDQIVKEVIAKIEASVKEGTEEEVKQKGLELYGKELGKLKQKMTVSEISTEYEVEAPGIKLEQDGFKISKAEYSRKVLNSLFMAKGDKTMAEKMTKDNIEQQIKIAKIAVENGILVSEDVPSGEKLREYQQGLLEKFKSEINPTDTELKKYFTEKKENYDKNSTVDVELALSEIVPSVEDKEIVKKKAELVLKDLTNENFAENAKKYSEDPGSAVQGGDLGWFGRGMMVKEFEKIAFEGEIGKIHPELVETQFGYHILNVEARRNEDGKEEAKAAHILFRIVASEKTKNELLAKMEEIKADIQNNKVTFEKLTEKYPNVNFSKNFNDIGENGYMNELGYQNQLVKNIFAATKDVLVVETQEAGIFMYRKTGEKPEVLATLENTETKNEVLKDYKNEKANEKILKLSK